jgi:sugar phosphate isomerase/epimerase
MDRRTFIGTLSAAAVMSRFSWAANEHRIEKIGLELYTVRDALKKDFEGTLAKVAKIGYKEVEMAGYFEHMSGWNPPPKQARQILDSNGLAAPATHVPYAALSPENWPKIIEASEILGHKYVVNPSIDRSLSKTADGWKRAAETFNRAGKESLRSGIQLGYHNHVEEFKPVDGKLPYDILLSETDPKLVVMEMDLGWAHEAGADPLKYFAKYPGRFPLVHVKDFTKDQQMTDVGKGEIDWKRIFAKSELAGIKHYFVEFDDPKSPFESIQASYTYLEKLRF